jgi:hypothetical protein
VKDLKIQLWHKDFDEGIILIPDLDSYPLLNPRSLPGVGQSDKQAGWYFVNSYFGFLKNPFKASFGLYSLTPFGLHKKSTKFDTPQMYFNLTMQRSLIYTLTVDIFTIFIILLLLFIVLLTYQGDKSSFLDLIGGAVVTLLFSTLVAQLTLLNKTPPYEFTYLESLYFIVSLVLILETIIVTQHRLSYEPEWMKYKNNIITKVLFWPVVLSMIFASTTYYLF